MERAHQIPDIYTYRSQMAAVAVLKVLAYFDIFQYPLTAAEIHEYMNIKGITMADLKFELENLVQRHVLKRTGTYYYFDDATCVLRREQANEYSQQLLKETLKYTKIISRFPFVRGICISGSLSKQNAHLDADVDYFIITAKNRLWICRTLLALYKKIFLLNSRKYFCINYFVDMENLAIIDKNIYTATEIAFLLPVFNSETFLQFLAENTWVSDYYPHKEIEIPEPIKGEKPTMAKKLMEGLLNNAFGNMLDNVFLRLTVLYRKLKFRGLNENEFKNNLRALKGVSKHHPHSFQERVLKAYHHKLAQMEKKFWFDLN